MQKLKLGFVQKFDYDKHFPFYDLDEIKRRVKKSLESVLCDMQEIEYAGENERYIEFFGMEHYPYNPKKRPEKKKILVGTGGNVYVIPPEAIIENDLPLTLNSLKHGEFIAQNIQGCEVKI